MKLYGLVFLVSPQRVKVYLLEEIRNHEQVFVSVFIFHDSCMIFIYLCVCVCVIQDMLNFIETQQQGVERIE